MEEQEKKMVEEMEETIIEEKFWEDPKNILNLIDIIFLCDEEDEKRPRS